MKTQEIEDVLSWVRSTDLVEVGYKKEGDGFSFALAAAQPSFQAPAARAVVARSPAIGIFQKSAPGRAASFEEGSSVKQGDALGAIETARGKTTAIPAPESGRIAKFLVEPGSSVEYGQPLFLIERV
jgi:acetyl-CoA carboxylase biotin carboxyl carrier protein